MALRTLRFLGFPRGLAPSRYHPNPNPSSLPRSHQTRPHSHLSEQSVLDQLSHLLNFEPQTLNPPPKPLDPPKPDLCVAERLLSPEDRLRGVFLQKLKGKFAAESALSGTGVDLTPDIFAGVVNRGNMGAAEMVCFFEWAVKQPKVPHCTETYNVIVKALGRRRFFSFMEEILLRMKKEGVRPDSKTVLIVLDSFVAARRVYKAVDVFDRLEEFGAECDNVSLTALLHSLCRWSHVRVACSVFNKMRGKLTFSTSVYNEIIGGWAKLGRVDEVERYWAAMLADGLRPDSQTLSHLVRCLGRAGRVDDAIDAFERGEKKGCIHDAITFDAMISILISAKDLDKAIEYYEKMVEKDSLPGADTYTKLICALLKFRRVSDALEIYDEMLDRGIHPTTGMITSFVEPLCGYGPPHAAMLIYKKAKKLGCKVSLKAYKLLLMRLSKFGKCGMVLKIWEEMQECGFSSDVEIYEYIVDGLCNIGKLDHAVLVVEESLKNGFCIRRLVYSKLSNKLLEMNKVETAYKLLLKVREARSSVNMQRIWRYKGWHV